MLNNESDLIARLTEEARILGEARMLRDEQELTPELTTQVIQRFHEYLERAGKKQEWAARSLGVKSSTFSQILSGTYGADTEKHVRAIDKWIEAQILKENAPRPAGFVKTTVAEEIYAGAKWAVQTGTIVLVHGPAGIGKTITAQAIRAEMPGSIFISIRTAGQSKLSVLESIAQTLLLRNIKVTSWQLFRDIERALKDTGRLLIVDEVHKLEGRRKDEALHTLRDLHDAAGIPMLWLGMSNIAAYIQSGQDNGYEPLDQLCSRIGLWINMKDKATGEDGGPGLATIDDIRKFVNASKLRVTPDGESYLKRLACSVGDGAYRTVKNLLQLASRLAKGEAIDASMLLGIQERRLGKRAAEALEKKMHLRMAKAG